MLDGVRRKLGDPVIESQGVDERSSQVVTASHAEVTEGPLEPLSIQQSLTLEIIHTPVSVAPLVERKKWSPKSPSSGSGEEKSVVEVKTAEQAPAEQPPSRKAWNPKRPSGE
jgi:hypothetical protein